MHVEVFNASDRRCLGCNYRLEGLTETRCPECGREFDPNDARTWSAGRPFDKQIRRLSAPPGWWTHGICVTLALSTLAAMSMPGGHIYAMLSLLLCWLTLFAMWSIRGLTAFGTFTTFGADAPSTKRSGWHWLFLPAAAGLTWCLIAFEAPVSLTFWISRPPMQKAAENLKNIPGTYPPPDSIGILYRLEQTRVTADCVYFQLTNTGSFEDYAIAYCPQGAPPPTGVNIHKPFQDDWYIYIDPY